VRELLDTYRDWRREGLDVGRAIVVRAFGSTPRGEGAVLLVAEDGRMVGSVSGGCVEVAAADEVLRSREAGREWVVRYGLSDDDGWGLGLACGGTIDVLIQPSVPEEVVEAAERSIGSGPDAVSTAVVGRLPAGSPPAAVGAHRTGRGSPSSRGRVLRIGDRLPARGLPTAVAHSVELALHQGRSLVVGDGPRPYFIEVYPQQPRLIVVGATEVSRWLVRFARDLGYLTAVIDARPAFATPERFPDVDRLLVAWPDEAFAELGVGPNDAVAVLSHDPKFDEPAIVEAFSRRARYVGAVGSRKSQASRRDRLVEAGLSRQDLADLNGPIGLDLGGREPAEMALAILAEIVAERRGGTGTPLRSAAPPLARTNP
jgi:xanthine dehydrogenase accessory factor